MKNEFRKLINKIKDKAKVCPYCEGQGWTLDLEGERVDCEFCNGMGEIR